MFATFMAYYKADQSGRNAYELGCIHAANALVPRILELMNIQTDSPKGQPMRTFPFHNENKVRAEFSGPQEPNTVWIEPRLGVNLIRAIMAPLCWKPEWEKDQDGWHVTRLWWDSGHTTATIGESTIKYPEAPDGWIVTPAKRGDCFGMYAYPDPLRINFHTFAAEVSNG